MRVLLTGALTERRQKRKHWEKGDGSGRNTCGGCFSDIIVAVGRRCGNPEARITSFKRLLVVLASDLYAALALDKDHHNDANEGRNATPLPWGQLFIVLLVQFAEPITGVVILISSCARQA